MGNAGSCLSPLPAHSSPGSSTSLIKAAASGRAALLVSLLEWGGDPNASGGGTTALCAAAARGHADCVAYLLDAGADPSLKEEQGRTALQLAQAGGHAAVARMLRHARMLNDVSVGSAQGTAAAAGQQVAQHTPLAVSVKQQLDAWVLAALLQNQNRWLSWQ